MIFIKNAKSVQGAKEVSLLQKWEMAQAINRTYNGTTVKVALFLLHHRNSKSGRCDPSYETLATEAGINRRSAIRIVRRLQNDGWLIKCLRRDTSNLYDFNWNRLPADGDRGVTGAVTVESPASDSGVTPASDSGVTQSLESESKNLNQERNLIGKTVSKNATIIPLNERLAFVGDVFKLGETLFKTLQAEYKHIDLKEVLGLADCYYRHKALPAQDREFVLRKWLSKANAEAKPKPVYGVDYW